MEINSELSQMCPFRHPLTSRGFPLKWHPMSEHTILKSGGFLFLQLKRFSVAKLYPCSFVIYQCYDFYSIGKFTTHSEGKNYQLRREGNRSFVSLEERKRAVSILSFRDKLSHQVAIFRPLRFPNFLAVAERKIGLLGLYLLNSAPMKRSTLLSVRQWYSQQPSLDVRRFSLRHTTHFLAIIKPFSGVNFISLVV